MRHRLPGIYVTLFACLPLSSLFLRYAHLTVMISLSRERGLLWLRHVPLQSLALRFGTDSTRSTLLAGEPSASFRSLKTALFSLSLSHWKRFRLVCTARSAT